MERFLFGCDSDRKASPSCTLFHIVFKNRNIFPNIAYLRSMYCTGHFPPWFGFAAGRCKLEEKEFGCPGKQRDPSK
jgi:hypothetical protein